MIRFNPSSQEFDRISGSALVCGMVHESDFPQAPYKRFYVFLGDSDIAQLTMVGFDKNEGAVPAPLKFEADGVYRSWIICNSESDIPEYYSLVKTYDTWLKIFDDRKLTLNLYSPNSKISVYRAGMYGCIVSIKTGDSTNE